ncbi:MAG: hypothetical protein AAF598_15730 [Bacteroidota bacterium]
MSLLFNNLRYSLLLLIGLLPQASISQPTVDTIFLSGVLLNGNDLEQAPLQRASIQLLKEGFFIDGLYTDYRGNFRFSCHNDSTVQILVIADGYIPYRLKISDLKSGKPEHLLFLEPGLVQYTPPPLAYDYAQLEHLNLLVPPPSDRRWIQATYWNAAYLKRNGFAISAMDSLLQNNIRLEGKLQDVTTRGPLTKTSIDLLLGDQLIARTWTNKYGAYILKVPHPGNYTLQFNQVGFYPQILFNFEFGNGDYPHELDLRLQQITDPIYQPIFIREERPTSTSEPIIMVDPFIPRRYYRFRWITDQWGNPIFGFRILTP